MSPGSPSMLSEIEADHRVNEGRPLRFSMPTTFGNSPTKPREDFKTGRTSELDPEKL